MSALLDNAKKMINDANFNCLFAVRDLYPTIREKKSEVVRSIQNLFNQYPFSKKLKHILAIMEIEAWFLEDYSLFQKIDSRLTAQYIKEQLKIDLVADDPEQYPHPANIIDNIYQLIGMRYKKSKSQIYNIVSNLDYTRLCTDEERGKKISSFDFFLNCFNNSLPK